MQNVECKYELRDLSLARGLAKLSGASFIATLEQTDTYFKLTSGRLKKRETIGESTEWVFYDRTNMARPRISTFVIYTEDEAHARGHQSIDDPGHQSGDSCLHHRFEC